MGQLLLRVDKREKVEDYFNNREIIFSCPANWYDYAIKNRDFSIGDQRECVYAHLNADDERINENDSIGQPMGSNLSILQDDVDHTVYLRHLPVLLTPALCFYQANIKEEEIEVNNCLRFDVRKYCKDMKYSKGEALLWVIFDAAQFEKEIKTGIIDAVYSNSDILDINGEGGYINKFDKSMPMNFQLVDYDKFDFDKQFYAPNNKRLEIWWKHKDYRNQNEGRIVIPHVSFKQQYVNPSDYDWTKNQLKVRLNNIKNYSMIVDPEVNNYIAFFVDKNNEIKITTG